MKTQGEVEAAISGEISKFYSAVFGKGPKSITVNAVNSVVVVIVQNALTNGERLLTEGDSGRGMLKTVRESLVSAHEHELSEVVHGATETDVLSVHHNALPTTGEEAFVFSLRAAPNYRLNNNGKKLIVYR